MLRGVVYIYIYITLHTLCDKPNAKQDATMLLITLGVSKQKLTAFI